MIELGEGTAEEATEGTTAAAAEIGVGVEEEEGTTAVVGVVGTAGDEDIAPRASMAAVVRGGKVGKLCCATEIFGGVERGWSM